MRVLCFGGPLDRQVKDVEPARATFSVAVPDYAADCMREEDYRLHTGRNESGDEWRFAVLEGMEPRDEMARDSEPSRLWESDRLRLEKAKEAIRRHDLDAAIHFIEKIESALTLSRSC